MNKPEFISFISEKQDCSKVEAVKIINIFIDSVTKALGEGEEIPLVGFGKFSVSKIPARKGRNPHTKKEMQIAAYKNPRFKAGKLLKDACNK